MTGNDSPLLEFTRKMLIAVGIAAAGWLIIMIVIRAFDVLLLIYAGILLAVFMRGIGGAITRHVHVPMVLSLILVWLILISAIIVIPWLFGPNLAQDFNELFNEIPKSVARLSQSMGNWQWLRQAFSHVASNSGPLTTTILRNAMGIFSTVFGGVSSFLLILVLGLYFSVNPSVYVNGLIKLIPRSRREHGCEVLNVAGRTLFGWSLSRIVSMVAVWAVTYVGLLLLGVSQALTLSMVAGVFTFVPYLGPIASAAPAVLIALGQHAMLGLWVALLYLLAHLLEGYFITPYVQWRFISMPPALVLSAQVVMWLGAGIIGVILASPLVVVIRVLAELLYVRDALHDERVPFNPNRPQ